jgi:hypothetical protein
MKYILVILGLGLFIATASAQTNIIHISNSRVVINNYYVTAPSTNAVQTTNNTPELVVLPQELVEKLRWESFLVERQKASQRAYLRRIEKRVSIFP